MLRQALDAAEQSQEQEAAAPADETTPLRRKSSADRYDGGGTPEDDSSYEEDDFDDDEDGSNDEETESDASRPLNVYERIWHGAKAFFLLVANVENLWDTPRQRIETVEDRRRHRQNNIIVLFWFVTLALSYATERSTFKLLVDKAGPFRLFAVEMVTGTHALMLALGLIFMHFTNQIQVKSLGIPVVDVGLMALLDTVSLLLVFLTGYHVPPTLTVILVQFTLPLTAFLSQFTRPGGPCSCTSAEEASVDRPESGYPEPTDAEPLHPGSPEQPVGSEGVTPNGAVDTPPAHVGLAPSHYWGSLIIFVADLLVLIPAFYSIANPVFFLYADTIPLMTAYNTLLFAASVIPAAASQLYKEHVFTQYKQPVNMDYLNLLLSIFQFIFASVMSPLVYSLMGLGYGRSHHSDTPAYPSSDFSENFVDGLLCFAGRLDDEDQAYKYVDGAHCHFVTLLVVVHAFSIITVGVSVDKIVNAGATKVMYRGVSAGIILAVLCMLVYDEITPFFNYGPFVDMLNLLALILLILGSEIYHRVTLEESSFETVYPEVENLYDTEY